MEAPRWATAALVEFCFGLGDGCELQTAALKMMPAVRRDGTPSILKGWVPATVLPYGTSSGCEG